MEYDYEFMWDYELSCHDYLDESYAYTSYLDEDHARAHTDYQELAYMHYA